MLIHPPSLRNQCNEPRDNHATFRSDVLETPVILMPEISEGMHTLPWIWWSTLIAPHDRHPATVVLRPRSFSSWNPFLVQHWPHLIIPKQGLPKAEKLTKMKCRFSATRYGVIACVEFVGGRPPAEPRHEVFP